MEAHSSLGINDETVCIRRKRLTFPRAYFYRPNFYLGMVARARVSLARGAGMSPRGDGAFCRDFIFERKNCAICTGEPNCDLMNQVAAAAAMLVTVLALAAFFVLGSTCMSWCLRGTPPAARKPSTAAPASAHGEVSERS